MSEAGGEQAQSRSERRHVVATVDEIPAGGRKVVTIRGREIGIFRLGDEYFGLINRCPHQGAALCQGAIVSLLVAPMPGEYGLTRSGEMLRCPWHCWEFDIRTGKSLCDPNSMQARAFNVAVQSGADLVEGPFTAETVEVTVEESYVVVTM
jgi:nitrite reductase/ring-hydroxylating ferredoxin subunit